MISAMTGEFLEGPEAGPQYWYDSLRSPVEFGRAIQVLAQSGHHVFAEISPAPGPDHRDHRDHPGRDRNRHAAPRRRRPRPVPRLPGHRARPRHPRELGRDTPRAAPGRPAHLRVRAPAVLAQARPGRGDHQRQRVRGRGRVLGRGRRRRRQRTGPRAGPRRTSPAGPGPASTSLLAAAGTRRRDDAGLALPGVLGAGPRAGPGAAARDVAGGDPARSAPGPAWPASRPRRTDAGPRDRGAGGTGRAGRPDRPGPGRCREPAAVRRAVPAGPGRVAGRRLSRRPRGPGRDAHPRPGARGRRDASSPVGADAGSGRGARRRAGGESGTGDGVGPGPGRPAWSTRTAGAAWSTCRHPGTRRPPTASAPSWPTAKTRSRSATPGS